MNLRATAREIFLDTLRQVDLRSALPRKLRTHGSVLSIEGTSYDLARFSRILVIAVGKAALPMSDVLLTAIGPLLCPTQSLSGLLLGTELPKEPDPRLIYRLGAHPLPDSTSAHTARSVLHLLEGTTEQTIVFFLISGGASAMLELPLDPSISLQDLAAFHQALVHSGLTIGEMNTLRKHVSAVKGGRLAAAAGNATQCTLLISDVDPRQPEIIGSGPTMPDPTTLADCRTLLAERLGHTRLPQAINSFFHNPGTPETLKPGDPAFRRAHFHTLLSSDDLCAAAQQAAQRRGFTTAIDLTPDDRDFRDAATYLLDRIQRVNPREPFCLISAGELSVPVTATHGQGGRNQHFALHCALRLAETRHPAAVLSAGSDGLDGNSPAAGAVVDETTLARAASLGLDPVAALATFDSFPLLHTLGDTIITGPTGNNLRDLRLMLRGPLSS